MKIEHFAGYDLPAYADAIGADLDVLRCRYIAENECEPTDGDGLILTAPDYLTE